MKPLLSLQDLAWRLNIPLADLKVIAKQANNHYREWSTVDLKKGKSRNLKVPDNLLKKVQRRILKQVLMKFPLTDVAHGGVKGRSPMTNAENHLGKNLILNIDVRDFFPSVDHKQIAKMFHREFGCGRQTTWILTRLTTIDGQLPQGAPTSTMIANILLQNPIDTPSTNLASEQCADFTRFVDDITFSGEQVTPMINRTARALSKIGLQMWRSNNKLKITPHSHRQEVTGLTVNSLNGPSVSRYKRARVRAAIHQLISAPCGTNNQALKSIRGRLNHVKQTNPGSEARLNRQLRSILEGMEKNGLGLEM